MYRPDQEQALAQIVAAAEADAHVEALYLLGSWRTEGADRWSDLDLICVVASLELSWFPDLGDVFAAEITADDRGELRRVVYSSGLCVDLISVTPASVRRIEGWSRRPFHKGARPLIDRSFAYSHLIESATPTQTEVGHEELERRIGNVRFISIQALKKLARGDKLIAGHLALEAFQEAMGCEMIMRGMDPSYEPRSTEVSSVGDVRATVARAARIVDEIGNRQIDGYAGCSGTIADFCNALPSDIT